MSKVLLVDDDPPMVGFLDRLFVDSGHQTLSAFDGITALREFFTGRPDAAIVDLKMPHMDGFELCRRIREFSRIPIIVLTGLEQVDDKIKAFSAGADDHVVKPVSGRELVARVEVRLRRNQLPSTVESSSRYTDPHLTLDFIGRQVLVEEEIRELTNIEYSLLAMFVQRPGEALSLEYLLTSVWGPGYETADLVKWHISNLRKKLVNQAGKMPPIVTVRGFGYRYEPHSNR